MQPERSFFPIENSRIDGITGGRLTSGKVESGQFLGPVWMMIFSKPDTGSVCQSDDPLFDSTGSCANAY